MPEITFDKFDKLNRKPFADRLTTVISKFYPFYDSAFVLSLDAKFGSGKSTFLEMWKNDLVTQGYKVIEINAWETDFDEEPLIAIISALLDNLTKEKKVKNALSKAIGAASLAGDKILEAKYGVTIEELGKATETPNLRRIGEKLYKQHNFKKKAYAELESILKEAIQKLEKKPLIILVDELDRVRPTYAVAFLEAIKHIFSVQGICFVLAVDRDQLKSSIKQLYGDIDFENYYRRFITREARLEEASNFNLVPLIRGKYAEFINRKEAIGISFIFENRDEEIIITFISDCSKLFDFTPRQISQFFRTFSHSMVIINSSNRMRTSWVRAIIFLIGLSIKDANFYNDYGKKERNGIDLINLIKSLKFNSIKNKGQLERELLFLLGAFSVGRENDAEYKTLIGTLAVNLNETDHPRIERVLSKLVYGDNAFDDLQKYQYLGNCTKNSKTGQNSLINPSISGFFFIFRQQFAL